MFQPSDLVVTSRAPHVARGRLGQAVRRRETWAAYLFLLPALVGLLTFTFMPFVASLYYSFTDYNVLSAPRWVGLSNYTRLLQSQIFWTALGNTALYALGTIPLKLIIGLVLALLLNRALRGVTLFRALYYSPVVTASVAVAVIWLWMYHPSGGILNQILSALHLPPQRWLLDPRLALPSLMVVGIWKYSGYAMLLYLVGLQGIPQSYYEAASIDGAGPWQQLRSITIPLLLPVTFYLVVTNAIFSFQVFEQIYVMTQGGPGYATTTVVYEIYVEAFERFKMGYASAIAFVLFVIIFALTLVSFKVRGTDDDEY